MIKASKIKFILRLLLWLD